MSESRKNRMVWIYKPRRAEMLELKRGDVFQIEKASPEDHVDDEHLFQCCSDAEPIEPGENKGSTAQVVARKLIHDPAPQDCTVEEAPPA